MSSKFENFLELYTNIHPNLYYLDNMVCESKGTIISKSSEVGTTSAKIQRRFQEACMSICEVENSSSYPITKKIKREELMDGLKSSIKYFLDDNFDYSKNQNFDKNLVADEIISKNFEPIINTVLELNEQLKISQLVAKPGN